MHDVIIIGAGFSGLSAALELRSQGIDNIVVLEARDRVGGRTKSGKLSGLDIDLGGMWLSETQLRLKFYAEKFDVKTYPTYLAGKAIFKINNRTVHGKKEKIDKIFNLFDAVEYLLVRRKLHKLSSKIDCDAPWQHPEANRLDSMTLEGWIQENIKSKRLQTLYRLVCVSVFCAEAVEVSMLFFLHYIKSGDGFDKIISADAGGAQNFLFHGGLHQIAASMALSLNPCIHLNTPVTDIEWEDNSVTVRSGANSYKAKRAIIAMPPTMLSSIEFSPRIQSEKLALNNRMIMGSAIKFWISYKKPFWRELGFNGLIFTDDSPVSPTMDVTPPDQELGILAGFFDGKHAIVNSNHTSAERREIVVSFLAQHYGEEARNFLDYVDLDWATEEWSEGCYGAFAPPGAYTSFGPYLRATSGPLHWAGTETSPRWTGYVEGAIQSGERAATEVLSELQHSGSPN